MAELEGLEFLRKNVIEEKKCDLKSNFAFISYAHDEADVTIVRNVFHKLYEAGYNLWIDTANIPMDENSWKMAAQEALMNDDDTCKVALFFRSEESMVREPIFEELEMIKELPHIHRIIVIDIWHDDTMTAEEFRKKLIREKKKKALNICSKICTKVSVDSSVFRMRDVNSNLDELVSGIAKELEKDEVFSRQTIVPELKEPEEPTQPEEPKEVEKPRKPMLPPIEGYTYTIFDREYTAGKREQGKLMYDAFSVLTKRHPDMAEALTQLTSVARAEHVTAANTKDANPVYFRISQSCMVGEQEYYVGASYGFDAKLAEIKRMFKICGEDVSKFVLNGEPLTGMGGGGGDIGKPVEKGDFVYTLWGIPHTAGKLADLMHDVFDLIAEKYPAVVPQMAANEKLTSVALKSDVDEARLPSNKLNYFAAKKEHMVDGVMYYVSTRYNREQGIGQLGQMLALCEGTADAFQISAMPDKSVHHTSDKKGLGELL